MQTACQPSGAEITSSESKTVSHRLEPGASLQPPGDPTTKKYNGETAEMQLEQREVSGEAEVRCCQTVTRNVSVHPEFNPQTTERKHTKG